MAGRTRLANHAWEALLQAHATLMKEFAAEDIWTEVSMREYDVLYTLSKCPGPIRLSELHRYVLLSQPALSRMVDRLATRGLLARAVDPRDARGVLLRLTAAGRATQRRVGRRHARSVATAMSRSMAVEDMARLESLCGQLARQHRTRPEALTSEGIDDREYRRQRAAARDPLPRASTVRAGRGERGDG
jgi:DNA-binding MarR family transcriptional regulator